MTLRLMEYLTPLPIAYNDSPGIYELTVTDLSTRKTATRTWWVR